MTNHHFAEYSTSTAFSIQLSKNQCNALLRCENLTMHRDPALTVGTLRPLEARGLVFWNRNAMGNANGFGGLTEAGRLMVGLLKEAGLTIESTNTVSVLRRIDRESA